MKPLRLRATNFRTFATLDLELHAGLVGILGELRDAPDGADSNGAGKSSILEAIDICLFGRRSLAGFLTRGGDVTELMLELTFEHTGSAYKVRRTFSARTKAGKTTCDFECWQGEPLHSGDDEGPRWEPLTRSSTKETDQLIVETIGLTRDTFRNSSYLRQGDGSYADPARDPKQRKDLLVEAALGRDPVWPKLVDAAKAAKKLAVSQLERIAGETRAAHELVDGKPELERDHLEAIDAEKEAAGKLAAAEVALQEVSERYLAAKDGAAKRQTCEAQLQTATGALATLRTIEQRVLEAGATLTASRTQLAVLPTVANTGELVSRERDLVTAIDAHREAVQARERALQESLRIEEKRRQTLALAEQSSGFIAAMLSKIEDVKNTPDRPCDLCGQALHDEARATTIAAYEAEVQRHNAKATELRAEASSIVQVVVPPLPDGEPPTAQLAEVRAQLAAAQQAQQERVRLEERITACEATIKSEPELAERIANAQALVTAKQTELEDIEPVNLATIEAAGAQARTNVARLREELDNAKTRRARLDERIAALLKAEAQLAAAIVQEAELQAVVDVETVIERACGRDGIPALIIENHAIPYIETVATEILQQLGTGFRVELRTQAALKSGDGLRDTLEVVVIDPDGNEAEFADGTSGGEQTRIGLALRIALARLLANRRGAESRLLALDEPSYLDAAGMTALLQVLRGLQGEFDQILLVSHVPELRDSLDDAIVVVKDGGRSSIAGAAVREQVAEAAAA